MMAALWFALLELALEVAGMMTLCGPRPPSAALPAFLAMHGAACLAAGLTFPRLLPEHYRPAGPEVGLFFVVFTLAMPLLGMLGTAFFVLPALWRQQRSGPSGPNRIRSQTPPWPSAAGASPAGRTAVAEGCLMGMLAHSKDRRQRLRALVATLALDDQRAVPLLRIGLKDADDDVRLLAYGLLMRKEQALEKSVGKARSDLENAAPAGRFPHHRALARDFWELSQLGNAGSSAGVMLERARTHAQAALLLEADDAGMQFLLGRIFLKEANLAGAAAALGRAVECGIAPRQVLPFLAEIAFHRRQFSKISRHLTADQIGTRFPLGQLAAYWGGA